jgi:hypothetical protein
MFCVDLYRLQSSPLKSVHSMEWSGHLQQVIDHLLYSTTAESPSINANSFFLSSFKFDEVISDKTHEELLGRYCLALLLVSLHHQNTNILNSDRHAIIYR